MSGDTERRLVEVLRRAAALPPDQRRTWIEFTSGGDPRLHAGLEALLRESATLGAGAALATGAALEGEVARELAARLASQGGRDLTGRQVGSIRLDALLGEGGMGSVYRGFDARLDRAVAVKTVRHPSPEGLARFRDEARLLGGTEHPGICRVYDLLEEPDCDFLVLELIDGLPLGRWAQAGHDLDARLAVAEQLAEALAFAHARGIVHRDLKPDNILVTPDGKARILDFGIATLVRPEATGEAPETPDAGRFAGTPGHMSPEQARGEPVGPPSDLFALGLILHELVSGRPAYPRDLPPEELFARARRGETEPLPALDRDLRELIASLENPIPSRRPSAVETAARLAGLRAAPQRRRRRRAVAALAAAAGVLIVVTVLVIIRERLASARTAAESQRFAREAEEIGWRMAVEELAPRRSLAPVRDELLAQIAGLTARIPQLPEVARPLADSAVGRAALALGDLELARTHLDAAWSAGARDGALAWSRARLYGRLFAEAQERERLTRGRAESSPATEALRLEAVAMLAAVGDAADRDAVEAELALYEGRLDDGLAAVERRLAARPASWSAHLTAARLHRAAAAGSDRRSDYAAAAGQLGEARVAASAAVEIARSSPEGWLELCRAAFQEAVADQLTLYRGSSPAAEIARTACASAAEVAPWSTAAAALEATVVLLEVRRLPDLEAVDRLTRDAVAELDGLLHDDADEVLIRGLRAYLRQVAVERRMEAAGESEHLPGLLEDRLALAAAEPGNAVAWARYCQALGFAAGTALSRVAPDSETRLTALIEALDEGGRRFPDFAYFQRERQLFAPVLLGAYRLDSGGDCETPFAETASHRAAALTATDPSLPRNVALALDGLTQCRLRDERPVGEEYLDALAVGAHTLELAPEWASSHFGLGWSQLRAAEALRATGRSPLEHLAAAERAYARGFELEPSRTAYWVELAEGRAIEAAWRLDRSEDPAAALARARQALARGVAAHGEDRDVARARARLAALESRDRLRRGEPTGRALAAARAAIAAARAAGVGEGSLRPIERELERARPITGS